MTFLFTDLVGSTRLWDEHPEEMKAALASHDELLRAAVEAHGGHVVKTTGDGLHAAFGTADDAVAAAAAGQTSLGSVEGPEGQLLVRMGVHTGAATHRDGDYFGTAVNRAARLAAAAHGGQVLVSLATAELLGDSIAGDASLLDLGEHRLRDLSRPERVFQLRAPGLGEEFPRLRTLDAYAGNLPLQLTSFVGRDDELDRVAKAIDEARLVTLIGVGGVGKTRLATQVAAEVLPRFPDGAWLCELAAASDADALVQVVAATLGVQPHPNVSLEGSIVEFLRNKELLVVLDNCEHLLDDAGLLAEAVLHECGGVRILATSREGLAVEGEQVWPLRSLRMPKTTSVDDVATSAAVRLFVERAQAAVPGFAVDAANAGAVAEICKRLDGIPLAIELAAARVAAMSPTEIAALLDERFRLLTGGRRTAVERHQTLRATVDWSYSLLEPSERLVFDRLGVFSGSFDTAAASAVVAGDGIEQWDVLDAMASLVGKSMVNAEKTPEDTTRYSMLETLRQYAREQLDESGAADDWRRRHARHYAAFAERTGVELTGVDELAARRRVRLELDNLRAAVNWSLDSADPADVEVGVGIVADLAYECSANMASGIGAWAERAVEPARASTPTRLRAILGAAAYHLLQGRGEWQAGAVLADEGILIPFFPGERAFQIADIAAGMACMRTGDLDRLHAIYAEAHRQIDTLEGVTAEKSTLHSSMSTLLASVDDLAGAQREAEVGLRLARESQNPTSLALGLFATAWSCALDDPSAALAAVDESIALTRAGAVDGAYGAALCQAASLRARGGDSRLALEHLREAIAYSHEVGDNSNLANAVNRGAAITGRLGYHEISAALAGLMETVPFDIPINVQFLSHEQADHYEVQIQVRSALGDAAYEAAAARGAKMADEEIVQFVLGELDRILADLDNA